MNISDYLNMPIKEIIAKFPKIADILNEYNIGCVPCSVGSCLLKDIVEIHNLSPENELVLMSKIANIIFPGQKIDIGLIKRKSGAKPGEYQFSPPIKRLVDEHTLIKRLLALIPDIIKNFDIKSDTDKDMVRGCVDFIRSYADKYHHAKEEEILFKYTDENADIIKAMYADHETGRSHVRAIIEGLKNNDSMAVAEHLEAYKELLSGHIKKEDEILYPWIDRNLSTSKVGELFEKFNDAEASIGESVPNKYRYFVEALEKKFKK